MTASTARGIRNNNPGNIRRGPQWVGVIPTKNLSDLVTDETEYAVFKHAIYGIRAMAILLMNYKRKHGIKTFAALVARYAPKADSNPEKAYAKFLADALGKTTRQQIDLEDWTTLMQIIPSIIQFENGSQPYSSDLIGAALELAEVPGRPSLELIK